MASLVYCIVCVVLHFQLVRGMPKDDFGKADNIILILIIAIVPLILFFVSRKLKRLTKRKQSSAKQPIGRERAGNATAAEDPDLKPGDQFEGSNETSQLTPKATKNWIYRLTDDLLKAFKKSPIPTILMGLVFDLLKVLFWNLKAYRTWSRLIFTTKRKQSSNKEPINSESSQKVTAPEGPKAEPNDQFKASKETSQLNPTNITHLLNEHCENMQSCIIKSIREEILSEVTTKITLTDITHLLHEHCEQMQSNIIKNMRDEILREVMTNITNDITHSLNEHCEKMQSHIIKSIREEILTEVTTKITQADITHLLNENNEKMRSCIIESIQEEILTDITTKIKKTLQTEADELHGKLGKVSKDIGARIVETKDEILKDTLLQIDELKEEITKLFVKENIIENKQSDSIQKLETTMKDNIEQIHSQLSDFVHRFEALMKDNSIQVQTHLSDSIQKFEKLINGHIIEIQSHLTDFIHNLETFMKDNVAKSESVDGVEIIYKKNVEQSQIYDSDQRQKLEEVLSMLSGLQEAITSREKAIQHVLEKFNKVCVMCKSQGVLDSVLDNLKRDIASTEIHFEKKHLKSVISIDEDDFLGAQLALLIAVTEPRGMYGSRTELSQLGQILNQAEKMKVNVFIILANHQESDALEDTELYCNSLNELFQQQGRLGDFMDANKFISVGVQRPLNKTQLKAIAQWIENAST